MAGDDDGNGVGTVGRAHSTAGRRFADDTGNVAIGAGCAVIDTSQGLPDSLLKIGSCRCKANAECLPGAGEVVIKLLANVPEEGWFADPVLRCFETSTAVRKNDMTQSGVVGCQSECANGGVVRGCEQGVSSMAGDSGAAMSQRSVRLPV